MITKYRNTKRDRKIKAAAELYFNKIYDAEKNCRDYKGSAYDEGFLDALDQAVETAFIAGAVFSDENPRPGLLEIEHVKTIYETCNEADYKDFIYILKSVCKSNGWL